MTMTPQQYTKLYRKVFKNKWYNAEHDGSTFSYRIISFDDIEMYSDRVHCIKLNIEVKNFKWNERRIWGLDARYRNRTIRNYFTYYQSESEFDTMIKILGLDTKNLKIKTLKVI